MKKFVSLITLMLLASMILSACSNATAPASAEQPTTAPVVQPTTAPAAVEEPTAVTAEKPATSEALCKPEEIRFVNSMREIAQPYHAGLDKGGRLFVKWVGLDVDKQYVLQLNQGDTDKQISLMRTLIADNAKCTIFNVEPNTDVAALRMAEIAKETGASIVTHWDAPEGAYPFNEGFDNWIAHVSVPSFESGYTIAKALFEKMGGKGKIVAIEGLQSVAVAQQRFEGLQKALKEYPDIELLDHQTANWDRTQAFPIMQTWLTKYGADITGVWAANDDMGLGALEALREAGKAGKVPVAGIDGIPEAVQAVKDGEFVMTLSSDATYQGSIGLAMGYCILTGQVKPTSEWTKDQRMFYLTPVAIDSSNVDKFLAEPNPADYANTWSCDSLWSRSLGPSYPK
jgi:ribose transport system substrate-binding protein